jgi:hypothetical protein
VVVAEHDQRVYVPVPWVLGIERDISVAPANSLPGLGDLVDDIGVEQIRKAAQSRRSSVSAEAATRSLALLMGSGARCHQALGRGHRGLRR